MFKYLKNAFSKFKDTLICMTIVAFTIHISLHPIDCSLIASVSAVEHYPTVIIDAGHGGEDCGTVGISGIYEKDLNFAICEKLCEYLINSGFKAVMTRTEDALLYTDEQNVKGQRKIYDLKNRVSIANSYDDSIFISIHMNWFADPNCKGAEIYCSSNEASLFLGKEIREAIINSVQPDNKRTLKNGKGIYLLENSINPAILIECGFLSNEKECEKLSQKEYQKELCFSILCGIIEYSKKNYFRS